MGMASKTKVTAINVRCIYQLYVMLYTLSCTGNAPIRVFA
jgi:hypothetical protein